MKFVRSLTVARSEIIEFLRLWEISGDPRAPFEYLILTPLPGLTDQSRVNTVKHYFAKRSHIIFDSGGYAVQQGIISYEDLYQRLLSYYRANDWADTYILPDYVPTSGLSEQEVEDRVRATTTIARLFHAEMPPALRERAMPVVQGHTRRQIQTCVETYLELGVEVFGFRVHALGVGSPYLLHTLHHIGVYSFDSSCWLRTAGFGNVFMPFVKRRNITGGRLRERAGHQPFTSSEFQELQQETGHTCFFCTSFEELKHRRFYQILHNLTVIMDTVDSLNCGGYLNNPLLVQTVAANAYTRTANKV